MTGTFTTVDALTISYERRGKGPLLVCHPGGPGFSSLELADLAGLEDSLDLVLLNPRGTGGSARPADPRAYAIADYVDDLEALRESLGEETINVLGFSHGGLVAMAYAAAYPTHVDRLVLVGTLARVHPDAEQALEAKAGEPWYEDAMAALAAEQAGSFKSDEELGELAFRELPLYFARFGERERAYLRRIRETPNGDTLRLFNTEIAPTFDLRPDLALIDAPTLILVGEQDFVCGPVCAEEIADGIAGAEVVLIPDAGHFTFVEQPERFREEVLRFLG